MRYSEVEVTKLANDLANRLKEELGGEWKPSVWFNSWWFYSVNLGTLCVHESYRSEHGKRYCCYYNATNTGGTNNFWYGDTNSDSPKESVLKALGHMEDHLKKIESVITLNKELIYKEILPV